MTHHPRPIGAPDTTWRVAAPALPPPNQIAGDHQDQLGTRTAQRHSTLYDTCFKRGTVAT